MQIHKTDSEEKNKLEEGGDTVSVKK